MYLVVLHDAQFGNRFLDSFSDKWNAIFYLESYIYDWLDTKCGVHHWNKKVFTQTNTQYGSSVYDCNSSENGYLIVRNPKFTDRLCILKAKSSLWSCKLKFILDVEVIKVNEPRVESIYYSPLLDDSLEQHIEKMKCLILPELLQNLPVVTSQFKVTIFS
jgi:hypothetical protein